jgi:hypothetical protein
MNVEYEVKLILSGGYSYNDIANLISRISNFTQDDILKAISMREINDTISDVYRKLVLIDKYRREKECLLRN